MGTTHGMKEQCEASGATPSQIEFWCRLGVIVPAKESTGCADHRQFNVENILEATQLQRSRELTQGCSPESTHTFSD
jgi:DNA-binding transcriptional MerR regulator